MVDIQSLASTGLQINIYLGSLIFFTGIFGGILNVIVFLSLKTFRESSCAFYLIVMSFVNIGQLVFGLFTRIMTNGFNIDWTIASLFYCKFRNFLIQFFLLSSFSCVCLAIIDQFLATCSNRYWQQWSNIKLARILSIAIILVWILHGIPFAMYYNHLILPGSGQIICTITNDGFRDYVNYVFSIVSIGIFPVVVTSLFGFLAHRNVRQLAYRTVPLVRRELDKQLTKMILVQGLLNFFFLLPLIIANGIAVNTNLAKDSMGFAELQFANSICLLIFYLYFSCPFYIYIGASERFRQQLIHVLAKFHLNRRQRRRIDINQVMPLQS